jgi:hypothetical protein
VVSLSLNVTTSQSPHTLRLCPALYEKNMNEPDRRLAEDVLNRLFKNSTVNGLRFFTPQLLVDGPRDIRQDGYVNLTSEWVLMDSWSSDYPEQFEELTQEQEEKEIHAMRGQEIEKVKILSPWPHLLLFFKSGKALYMNGKDEMYEPWTAGLTNHGKNSDTWLVVACPGGGLAVWAPDNWRDLESV